MRLNLQESGTQHSFLTTSQVTGNYCNMFLLQKTASSFTKSLEENELTVSLLISIFYWTNHENPWEAEWEPRSSISS